MNKVFAIISFTVLTFLSLSCIDQPAVDFEADVTDISVGPDAEVRTISIKSDDKWIVDVQEPWIAVSPANGIGNVECKVMIDSALNTVSRNGKIFIENLTTKEQIVLNVNQEGYKRVIKLNKPEISIESFEEYEKRFFDVQVETNVPFKLELDEAASSWITPETTEPQVNLDRNARPRKVTLRFDWKINSTENQRNAAVKFKPVDETVVVDVKDELKLTQAAPETIVEGVQGDSLALIAINRALGCWTAYEVNEKMEFWEGVEVWKSGPDKGRVKSASFYMFGTKESIPFQVRYLTAAEELSFFGNTNTFLLSLEPGDDLCKLERLKKLTISAYGLSSLPDNFKNLKNLQYLDISSNNFQSVPEVLNETNFPKMTALIMNACQRYMISDLYMTKKENFGGFVDSYDSDKDGNKLFPKRLLMWDNLDTLRLSVNYFEGSFPDLVGDPDFDTWTAEEVSACDTLPDILVGMPKVLPKTKFFAINHNRMHGTLPDWLLYHPMLDWWAPTVLVFPQEGVTTYNVRAGFDNEPVNLDYYYDKYVNKKLNPSKKK